MDTTTATTSTPIYEDNTKNNNESITASTSESSSSTAVPAAATPTSPPPPPLPPRQDDFLLSDYTHVDPWRVPQDPKTHFKAVFIPYKQEVDVFQIYLPRDTSDSDAEVKKMMKATAISKRYLAKKDESCLVIQDFTVKPSDPVAVHNHRANVILCSKKELYGNVVLTYRILDSDRVWAVCQDMTMEMYEKLVKYVGTPLFDFKNNYKKLVNYVEAICVPTDFKYPSEDETWVSDKLPHSILNEYYATIGRGTFQPVKHEYANGGPFACFYSVVDGDSKKTFASKPFKQLKAAQSNLALKLLHYYLGMQNLKLHGIPFTDTDTSYEEFVEYQEQFTKEQEEKALAKANKMEVDQVVISKTSDPKMQIESQLNAQHQLHQQQQNLDNSTSTSTTSTTESSETKYIMVFDKFKIPEDSVIMTLGEDRVTKFIIKQGKGEYPTFGTKIIAKYQTFLADGTPIDDKIRQETFDIGMTSCIRGMEFAMFNMKQGEKGLLKVEPEYGYGKLGAMPLVPPNSTLVIYIEILNIQHKTTPAQQEIDSLTPQEKLVAVEKCRAEGKHSFERKCYGKCIKIYKNALKYLDPTNLGTVTQEEWTKVLTYGTSMCVNLAMSYASMGIWERCRAYCTMGITNFEDEVSKPYYWRAKANIHLEQYVYAFEDIETAIGLLEETDIETKERFNKYRDYIKKHLDQENTKERKTFEKVFNTLADEPDFIPKPTFNSLYDDDNELEEQDDDNIEMDMDTLNSIIQNNNDE
ncbi:hypothetical protein DFA_07518 [Cavenderia fasciculata]|uniref:peptidylprolyl isomerase n=1 Tax=Cavenderia fasciculata TaxID=261658 RepID=F4PWN0_CACFS|nr:uncharacterized protein DFA_07518 [Cavenderia fasciculata]EGG20394.1 hypothetical protein DFA_07518 [Cavenderia fasciculata]|eukprot:XP_004367377.1 hypothetical protein DFA_07518 [Cavenderia fasciculata]